MEKAIFGNSQVKNTQEGILLDSLPLTRLANAISTPFYLVLAQKIRDNIKNLRKITHSIFDRVRISYSVKANYMNPVLHEINNQEVPFELISLFEYDLLKQNNLNRDNLIIGGPYLPDSLIESTILETSPLFILYNTDQIQRLQRIAHDHNVQVQALLRFIAPKTNGHLGFSPNSSTFNKLELTIPQCTNIDFQGVHSHYGTQINTVETYRKNIKYLLKLANILQQHHLFTSDIFDIGGGLPNAGALKENQLFTIFSTIKEEFETQGYSNPLIYMEPGRYIVEDAGLFLMEIIHVSDDSKSVFVNAGNYLLPRFARNLSRFYNINQKLEHYNHKITIYGIVPSEEDVLIKNYNFSPINEVGDKILVMNCGAYAFTFSNRFPYHLPPVVYIDADSYEVYELKY